MGPPSESMVGTLRRPALICDAKGETVITGPLGTGAGEFLTLLAGLEEFAFKRTVLFPQFVFANDAHSPSSLNHVPGNCGACRIVLQ